MNESAAVAAVRRSASTPDSSPGGLIFDASALCAENISHHQLRPFPFLAAQHLLPDSLRARIAADYPDYRRPGFFPVNDRECGPSIRAVIRSLEHPAFANRLGELLGVDNLGSLPTIVTLRKWSKETDGRIHNDSKSKVVTALLYLNDTWPDTSGGCFRVLSDDQSFDHLAAPEIKPLYGYFAAFRRTENSWHGHLPFIGERRVIQIAWLTSLEEKQRKEKRGRFTRLVKSLFTRR
jgi:hypothetical protein